MANNKDNNNNNNNSKVLVIIVIIFVTVSIITRIFKIYYISVKITFTHKPKCKCHLLTILKNGILSRLQK
jgi:hypothetical protein